ncbi:MAG: flavin reductase family protein [Candidatus Tectomicrobia bacterium]|uniref:Flavin reductase family protein n=1 Tax=Tectimicrobiota bacterium TaxID=2528274 RepID=A0A933LQT3_UNCTE|nr:flavin reductase family protein [Candidatus Tectomicrobia bacterium]
MQQASIHAALKKLEYGIYVVSTRVGHETSAFVASWLSQVSFEPPMVMIAIHKDHFSGHLIKGGDFFTVNIIGKDQKNMLSRFLAPSKMGVDKFESLPQLKGETGVPIMGDCVAYLECQVETSLLSGDHNIFVGHVLAGKCLRDGETLTTKDTPVRYNKP